VFNTPVVQDGSGGALIAGTPLPPAPIVSDAALTATALIAQARAQSGVVPTQPPAAFLVATATPFQAVPLQAGEMTATAMIVAATEAAYARETATATALGILPPTATLGPSPTYNPMLASQDCVHVVQRGQNVYRIALSYGVTIADVARANGLANSAVVRIGQELVIPGCGDLTPTPGVPAAVGGEAPPLAEACQQTHLIQPGENLYRIALRYGITMNELRNANGISNINVIKAGDTLTIPCR
jgi:LysM repeat protein